MDGPLERFLKDIRRRGPWAVAGSAIVFAAAVVGLLAAVHVIGLLIILVVALSVALAAYREGWVTSEHDRGEMEVALNHLRRHVLKITDPPPVTTLWRDEISVSLGGDATWHSVLRVRPQNEPLHFIEFVQAGEELKTRQRRHMKFDVRETSSAGPGTRLFVDRKWESDSQVRLWIHLLKPIQPGEEVTLTIDFTWPAQLPKLGKGGAEDFEWETLRPTALLEFVVSLDPAFKRREALGCDHNFSERPLQNAGTAGAWEISGSARDLSPNETRWLKLDAGA